MNRPGTNSTTTTPLADALLQMGQGVRYEGVSITKDQFKALQKLYGYTNGCIQGQHDSQKFTQAGSDRNTLRDAKVDGLRLISWMAKYVDSKQDPLKAMILMASNAGFNVDPEDLEWAETEDEDEDEE